MDTHPNKFRRGDVTYSVRTRARHTTLYVSHDMLVSIGRMQTAHQTSDMI